MKIYHNRIKNSCKKIFLLILSDTRLVQSVCWSLYNNLFRKWPRSINLPLLRNKNTHHGLPGIQQFVSQMTIIKKSQKVPSVTHSTEQYKIHWGSSTLQIYSKYISHLRNKLLYESAGTSGPSAVADFFTDQCRLDQFHSMSLVHIFTRGLRNILLQWHNNDTE